MCRLIWCPGAAKYGSSWSSAVLAPETRWLLCSFCGRPGPKAGCAGCPLRGCGKVMNCGLCCISFSIHRLIVRGSTCCRVEREARLLLLSVALSHCSLLIEKCQISYFCPNALPHILVQVLMPQTLCVNHFRLQSKVLEASKEPTSKTCHTYTRRQHLSSGSRKLLQAAKAQQ